MKARVFFAGHRVRSHKASKSREAEKLLDAAGFVHSHLKKGDAPGQDKFTGVRPHTRGDIQIGYAKSTGLGSGDYELLRLDAE